MWLALSDEAAAWQREIAKCSLRKMAFGLF
jgi:hypothetical protein